MGERMALRLSGAAETLLLPLYARARESQRADGVLHDPRAEQVVARLEYDFDRITLLDFHQVTRVMSTRELDRITRAFLNRHPDGVVAHLGCGLDTRFERVDNGSMTWFDLDLPEVADLRGALGLGDLPTSARTRYHLIGGSALDEAWLAELGDVGGRAVLIVAEGLLTYLPADQVRGLLLTLARRFPGAELAFEAFQPWAVRVGNATMGRMGFRAPMRWGMRRPEEALAWNGDFQLIRAWYFFDRPELRLHGYRWLRFVPGMRHFAGIYHFRLGVPGIADHS